MSTHVRDHVQKLHRNRCPVCAKVMQFETVKRFRRQPRNLATRGHDFPTSRGGNPHLWVWMCHGCNNDQGMLDLATWSMQLRRDGDVRELAALQLAVDVRTWAVEKGFEHASGLPPVPVETINRLRSHVEEARRRV